MSGRYFWGIILILIGAGFLLEQFDVISFGEMFKLYWPSILILLGIASLFDRKSSKFGSLILIIIGGALQVNRLDLFDFNAFRLIWPIILILIGLKVIFSKDSFVEVKFDSDIKKNISNVTLDDYLNESAVFSGIETNNQSQSFKGGRATALFGGIDVDLRSAKLYNNEATIELNAMFGGIDIYVPDDWRVEVKGTPVFGGWSNKTRPNTNPDAPVLNVKCFVLFGGVEIK
ncbi:MAG: cell wall-active antibiotics response protein [Tissierellia bacterium]|nr:cell wall-active antibiotics response protein [Tissierellia bacterium]